MYLCSQLIFFHAPALFLDAKMLKYCSSIIDRMQSFGYKSGFAFFFFFPYIDSGTLIQALQGPEMHGFLHSNKSFIDVISLKYVEPMTNFSS